MVLAARTTAAIKPLVTMLIALSSACLKKGEVATLSSLLALTPRLSRNSGDTEEPQIPNYPGRTDEKY
jgi:hypothetical protein